MLRAVYIMNPSEWAQIYPPDVQANISGLLHVLGPVLSADEALSRPDLLKQMDVLLSGWGGPKLNGSFLKNAPNLKGVFYGAGSVGYMLSNEFWDRKIVLTTANQANAIPVSEYSLAHILLGLKRVWQQCLETKRRRTFPKPQLPVAGAYRSTVGLVSLSTIGRLVRQRLKPFDVHVIAYDPTVSPQEAAAIGVELASLSDVFSRSDVVSLHAPVLPETVGLVTGAHLASMKYGATFINTARGVIVQEKEMIEVLRQRTDLTAVLDVTEPEPPEPDSPLFDLPNVILTPHIAGSLDGECQRMGQWVADEVRRFLAHEELLGQVFPEKEIAGVVRVDRQPAPVVASSLV